MITKLTTKQEKFLIKYREEILRYGRSTELSDRETTEKWITFFYEQIGENKPAFFWFDGPFSGYIGIELINNRLKSSNLGMNLESNLRSNLQSNLESNLRSNLQSNLRSNLCSNLRLNLWSNLGSNLWSNLQSNLGSNLHNSFWGQHELGWLAFYDFSNLIGIHFSDKERKILDGWLEIGKSSGWWCPFENICFCFERPNILNLDKEGRLHCASGPAMAFRDGYSLYYYHGKEIPREIIFNEGKLVNDLEVSIGTWEAFK